MTRPYEGLTAIECYKKGSVSLQSGQYREAVEAFTEALTLDREYVEAYRNRGNAYSKLGNYQQAITDYGKALTLDPNFAAAYYNRGVAYGRRGPSPPECAHGGVPGESRRTLLDNGPLPCVGVAAR